MTKGPNDILNIIHTVKCLVYRIESEPRIVHELSTDNKLVIIIKIPRPSKI